MSSVIIAGDTSGSITLAAPAVSGTTTLTLPATTDTLVGKTTTDTLTNKSIVATQLTGTIAAARLPTGSVLQVVQGTYSTTASNASASYNDTGLTATITPNFTTSKILVLVSQNGIYNNGSSNGVNLILLRAGSTISTFAFAYGYAASVAIGGASVCYLDSPATTSATIYKTQFKNWSASTSFVQGNSDMSTILLMEIAA